MLKDSLDFSGKLVFLLFFFEVEVRQTQHSVGGEGGEAWSSTSEKTTYSSP